MELSHCSSHAQGESVLFKKGLGEVYAEARETVLASRVKLASDRAENSLRVIRDCIMRELSGRGWKIGETIFPPSAPASFHRGHYRLDATKKAGGGGVLGIICHFGGSEFLVRKLMLISEAVRGEVVDCCVLALITRNIKPYISGRPACYEQAQRLLRAYGQSAFGAIPMILWGLAPEIIYSQLAEVHTSWLAGVQ